MPWLFDPEQSLLFRQQESPTTRQYREMADAQSELDGKRVTALELVERDIRRYELLAEVGPERYAIRRVLHLLYRARKELQPRPYTEQQLILRDVFKVDRRLPVSDDGRDYREFELPNDRRLRLRILHPDPPEHSTGADVIYEHYWDEKRMVRLAAIQYKVWEVGSKWLTYQELEALYRQHRILEADEHIVIHAQEFGPEEPGIGE